MSIGEGLFNLRKRVVDAVNVGVLKEDSKDLYEATLIQILNEAERNRQRCTALADQYHKQAAAAEAQANAFSQISSIIYNVLNGFVNSAEKANREQKELEVLKNKDLDDNERQSLEKIAERQQNKDNVEISEDVRNIQKKISKRTKKKT